MKTAYRVLCCVMVLMLIGIPAAHGQEVSETVQLTPELVSKRIQTLSGDEASESNEAILQSYQQIKNWLAEAAVHAANEKAFLQALDEAPAQESGIRDRMVTKNYRAEVIDTDQISSLESQDLQAALTELRVRLRDKNAARNEIENRISSEKSSSTAVQNQFEAIDRRLQEIGSAPINVEPSLAPSQFEAEQWSAFAERTALVALRRSLEAQLASQSVRNSLYAAQSSELGLQIEALDFAVNLLESELDSRRVTLEKQAAFSLDENAPGYEFVQKLIVENKTLKALSAERITGLEELRDRERSLRQNLETLTAHFEGVQQIVELAESSESLGPVLMAHWHGADEFRITDFNSPVAGDIAGAVVRRARFQEELDELISATDYVNEALAREYGGQPPDFEENLLNAAREQVRSRRQLLRELVAIESERINIRGSFARIGEQHGQTFHDYEVFLKSRILWVPSHPPISSSSLRKISEAYGELVERLGELRLKSPSATAYFALLFVLAILVLSKGIIRRIQKLSEKIGRARDDSIIYTLRVLLLTLIRSIAPPVAVIVLAYSLVIPIEGMVTAPYLAEGLVVAAKVLFLILLMLVACQEKGLAEAHFGWAKSTCAKVRASARTLLLWWWPFGLGTSFVFRLEVDSIDAVFGRLLFVIALAVVGTLMVKQLWPREASAQRTRRLRLTGAVATLTFTVFFIASILMGYLFSTERIYGLLIDSLLMGVGLLFFYFFMRRWLLVTRRRLRFQELVQARQAADDDKQLPDDDPGLDLVSISESVGQLLKTGTLTLAVIGITVIWSPIFGALEALRRVTLWTVSDMSEGEPVLTSITLASLVLALFIAVVAIYAARSVPRLLDLILRSRKNITPGSRYAAVKLVGYVIVSVGVLVFLSTLGLRWDRLQWLVAALGVGIGFGLQEIIANFISGLIILFEKPIRRGDVVTVGDSSGEVTRIMIRATLIRGFDGKELLVPNKEFVTSRLLNWTLSDNSVRTTIKVGIAYGSDVRKAIGILEDILARHELVLDRPEPDVLFREFGDSALNLEARCYVTDVAPRLKVISDLHLQIDDAFKEAGIVIAFPQIDVHFDSRDEGEPAALGI